MNLRVYFGQASRYYGVCVDILLDEGSLAAFLMKSWTAWRLLFKAAGKVYTSLLRALARV